MYRLKLMFIEAYDLKSEGTAVHIVYGFVIVSLFSGADPGIKITWCKMNEKQI